MTQLKTSTMRRMAPFSIVLSFAVLTTLAADETKPNIIFILADDLGYGDVGFMGQTHFETPCLDRMARQGIVFTQFYAGSTVCAPSRACLLTGQHTGHVYQRFNGEICFRDDPHDITIAALLQQAGYHTAMIGKSGLACRSNDGLLPRNKGFDYFYGFLGHRAAHRYYPKTLWQNGEPVRFENNNGKQGDVYSGEVFLQQSLRWIEDHREAPFFLHVSLQQPHADLAAPAEFRDRHVGAFQEIPFPDGEHYRAETHPKATFVGMIQYLDHSIGQILDKLVELGIDENTYVFFSSDNGPHFEGGAHPDHFDSNGPLRGGKRDLYEGGIRVPFVAWAPGRITAGRRSDHAGAFWDFAPTACELAGIAAPDNTDGISIVPTLHDAGPQAAHAYLYWEFYEQGGKQAVRFGDWKAVRLQVSENPQRPLELYNLADDIGETRNVASVHPDLIEKATQLMQQVRTPHPDRPLIGVSGK